MHTLLKKQIEYTEHKASRSILTQAWLLILHILLGAYHVVAMLFMSSSNSFQQVHDLTNEGYRVSYLDHCRMQHNVRFGTLAYSLVLVVALTLVRTTVEIVYPEQFGQPAYAANLVVTKAADTNDGVCDADCSLREAIAVANSNDTITFNGNYTITLGSTINYPGGRNNITVDGGSNTIVISGNGTVGICLQWNGSNNVLRKVTVQNCTSSAVNINGSTGAILDQVTLSGPAGAANSPLVAGASMELSNSTVSASGARDCVNVNGNNVNIHHNTITNCQNGIFTANGTTGTFSNNSIRATSNFAIRINLNGGGHTISNNTLGASGTGNQVNGAIYIGGNSTGNTISNNNLSFQNGGNAGIHLNGSQLGSGTNNTVTNNTIASTVVGTAIKVENSTRNSITANTITDSSLNGIQVTTNASNNNVSNNTITSVPNGIVVDGNSANVTISNNSITPDAGLGINIGLKNASGLAVTNNTIVAGGVGGTNTLIELNNVSNSTVSGNVLSTPSNNNPNTPIRAINVISNSSLNTITSNTITLNAAGATGVQLTSTDNTVSSNTIQASNTGAAGVAINGANSIKVYGNTITGIVGTAVGLSGNSSNTVIGKDASGTGSANNISNISGNEIQIKGSGVVNTFIRANNVVDNGDGVTTYYSLGAAPVTQAPALATHSVGELTGTGPANGIVDVYGSGHSGNALAYLGSTNINSNGGWSYSNNSLSTYTKLTLNATHGLTGTSNDITDQQPAASMAITNLEVDVTSDTSATFTWTTNVSGTSSVIIKSGDVEQSFDQGSDDTTNHIVVLTGLTADTDYKYLVTSKDSKTQYNFDRVEGNFSTDPTPDTTAPVISDLTVANIGTDTATITWTTDESTDSEINYGTTNAYGDVVTDDTLATHHSLALTGLTPNTTYHYSVSSTDSANNTATTDDATFTTADEIVVGYGDQVAQRTTITDAYNVSYITAEGSHSTLPATPGSSLTFSFNDSRKRFVGDRMHLVIALARQRQTIAVNRQKAFNAQGKVAFEVKQSLLEVGKKYVVSTGILRDGSYMNPSGLSDRFTFTLQDAPQLLYPALSANNHVFIGVPEEFVVASKTSSATVYLDDADGEVFHCTAAIVDGMGSCRPPFYPAGRGEYTVRVVDANGSTITTPLLLTALAANDTITTDSRSADFYNRVILGGQPTFVGIAGEGNTVEVHVPQIDGAIIADRAGITWSLHLTLTTLPIGETEVTVIEKRPDGSVVNNTVYSIYRSTRAVAPAVIAPADGSSAISAPQIQVIGPTTGDHILEVFNSAGTRLVRTNYDNGGRTIDLAQWYSEPGSYAITLVNRNRVNLSSRRVTFNFTIVSATPAVVTPSTDTNTNTAVEPDTNTNTNGSSNSNSNSNTNANPDSNSNTNTDVPAIDPDHDGLTSAEETDTYKTDPNNPDTDGDSMFDGDEVEFNSDPLTVDGDEDGLTDSQEYTLKTNPRDADSDDDGVLDGAEVTTQTSPLDSDSDDDGLSDNETAEHGTLPLDADTDNDRILDGDEIERQCDPLKADTDGDGINDLAEALAGTACTSKDNVWKNLTGLETYLQDKARTEGKEPASYPNLTTQLVPVDTAFKQNLNTSIKTATAVDFVAGAETVVSKGTVTVVTRTTKLSLLDWLNRESGTSSDDTQVVLTGQVNLPANLQEQPAYVVVTLFSTPTVRIAQVDPNGQWTMTVPAELLTTGEHTAFASVDVNGTQSDQVEVAKFVIQHERQLSNTAWLVIINVVIAVIALLTAFFIRLRHKRVNEMETV